MANKYMHGAYGHLEKSQARNAIQAGTVVVYFGTAPVNLIRESSKLVNTPIKLSNLTDAQSKVGFSNNWADFTLCEAIAAHFDNKLGNIGPIYVINVLDPEIHVKNTPTTVNLTFTKGRAEIKSETIIVDSLALASLVEDEDYTMDYDFAKGKLLITLTDPDAITNPVQATFDEIDPLLVAKEDIIGGVTSGGEYSGLGVLRLLYQEHNVVASLVGVPGWSEVPEVHNATIAACRKINGHWEAYAVSDIPLEDTSGKIDTIEKAISWFKSNGYNSEFADVCWPKVVGSDKRIYHMSTLHIAEMQRVDFSHDSIPFETCSNKPIPVTKLYFGENSKNRGYDQEQANTLNANGICTAVFFGGRWVHWGGHTSEYAYGKDMDPRGIFTSNIRMQLYLVNMFQLTWGVTIDSPMTLALRDTIMIFEQERLDRLKGLGALIGSPRIEFRELDNPVTDLMNGDFIWKILDTPTPPLKSATVGVTYTDEGFQAYFGGGE